MISVVIPVLNEANTIRACLSSITSSAIPTEVIVVDGGSRDRTMDLVRAFPDVMPLKSPQGRGRQMNRGARARREMFCSFFMRIPQFLSMVWTK